MAEQDKPKKAKKSELDIKDLDKVAGGNKNFESEFDGEHGSFSGPPPGGPGDHGGPPPGGPPPGTGTNRG